MIPPCYGVLLLPLALSAVEAQATQGSLGARAPIALGTNGVGQAQHPEAKPFPTTGRARHDIAAALTRARDNGHRILVIFGGNWCHDSRALAGWFVTPRFRDMLGAKYEIVWVNVGHKDKNLDVALSYGLDGIAGTPTVLMLDAGGKPLNLADAPTWRNAGGRSEDAIYAALAGD